MTKIIGVAKKPILGKRDNLLHWRIFWTPCRGAKKTYRWVIAQTRMDAYHQLKQLMTEHSAKVNELGSLTGFGLMRDELKNCLNSDNRPKKTIQQYEKVFNRVFVEFKAIYEEKHKVSVTSLSQIDYSYFVEFKDYFMLKLKRDKGWHNELIRIKSMLNHLRRKKFCSRELVYDVREELPTPPSNTVPYQDISDTDLQKLFTYIKKDNPDYYLPYRYMYLTGRRPRETASYAPTDVEGGIIDPTLLRIRKEITKTRTDGILYLKSNEKGLEELQSIIKEALRGNDTDRLFRNRHGRKCSVDKLYQYLKKTSKEVIKVAITPKYFRKRFHTKNISKDMKSAMAISGLKDTKVAMKHYAYTSPEGQAKVLAQAKVVLAKPEDK